MSAVTDRTAHDTDRLAGALPERPGESRRSGLADRASSLRWPLAVAALAGAILAGSLAGGWLAWALAALFLVLCGVQVHIARRIDRTRDESQALRSENADLRRQLTDRTLIAIARDAAVQANQSKSGFLAAASHDLRQPLQSLSLNVGALLRTPMDDNSRLICTEIGQSVDALRQMLDALLDISTLDAGGVMPNFCQIPLDRLLEVICAGFRPAAAAKGLQLACHCPTGTVVTSDVGMLRRVISNLVDNAVKFTERGGVTLDVAPEGERIRLAVADTGCGIQPGNLTRVFEDLAQIGNPERNRAFGHGLGLGIVRRLCHLLGIEHTLESSAREGTRFCLDIPGRQAGEVLSSEYPAPHPALISRRVLVLDDDAAVRNAYGHALRGLGCQVTCFATLAHALAHAAINQPELALVDYRLAQNDNGIDAVRRLRAVHPGLIALIVSADTTPELRSTAASESIPLLRKPVTDAVLAAAIHGALRDAQPRPAAPATSPG